MSTAYGKFLTCTLLTEEAIKSYKAARLKRQQLEWEIRRYADGAAQSNMLHTLSKLWMFLTDEFVPDEIKSLEGV